MGGGGGVINCGVAHKLRREITSCTVAPKYGRGWEGSPGGRGAAKRKRGAEKWKKCPLGPP